MFVRPGGSFFQSSVPPEPAALSGWLPISQLHTSRLWTACSLITSPERLASKKQSADVPSSAYPSAESRCAFTMMMSPPLSSLSRSTPRLSPAYERSFGPTHHTRELG